MDKDSKKVDDSVQDKQKKESSTPEVVVAGPTCNNRFVCPLCSTKGMFFFFSGFALLYSPNPMISNFGLLLIILAYLHPHLPI